MKMRVLALDTFNDPYSSVRPKSELFVELKKRGCEVHLMANGPDINFEIIRKAAIPIVTFYPSKKISLEAIRKIREYVKANEIDIVYVSTNSCISNSVFALINLPVKLIAYRGARGPYLHDPVSWITHLNKRVDCVVCNSNYVRDFLKTQLWWNKDKAVNIYRGQRVEWYENTIPASLNEFGIPNGSFVVSCVANIRRVKGAHYFLRAIDYVKPDLPVHFLLIGAGSDSKKMQKLLKTIKNSDKVHLAGFRSDALRLVASSSVYVQPSLSEGISRSVVEAMSLGVVPIVSSAGGNPELVKNGSSGIVVPVKDSLEIAMSINKLLERPDLRREYGQNAKERIKTVFNIDRTASEFIKLFTRLLE